MSVKFHLVDAAAVIERHESQHLNAKEMALHLSVAQIMASLSWVQHHTEKLRVVAADNEFTHLREAQQGFDPIGRFESGSGRV